MTWEGYIDLHLNVRGVGAVKHRFEGKELAPDVIRRAKAIDRAWDAFLRYRESRLSGMIRDEALASSVLKRRKASATEVALETGMTVSRARGAAYRLERMGEAR